MRMVRVLKITDDEIIETHHPQTTIEMSLEDIVNDASNKIVGVFSMIDLSEVTSMQDHMLERIAIELAKSWKENESITLNLPNNTETLEEEVKTIKLIGYDSFNTNSPRADYPVTIHNTNTGYASDWGENTDPTKNIFKILANEFGLNDEDTWNKVKEKFIEG